MTILEKLPNLCKLYMFKDAYLGTKMVCTAQGFPKLEYLSLNFLKGLKQWTVEAGALQILDTLKIVSCNKLEMLPEGLRHLDVLETLVIGSMPDVFVDRMRGIDGAEGVDMFKISHIPDIHVHQIAKRGGQDICQPLLPNHH